MVERSRRRRGNRKLLGSHQRCWLWGRHLVTETLRAGRWPVLELLLSDRLSPDELYQARQLAARQDLAPPTSSQRRGTILRIVAHDELTRLGRTSERQGYLAKMPPFPYAELDTVLARSPANPLYLLLDQLQDSYNFGAVLRSADGLGVDAVFVGAAGQSEVTSLAARASAGAVNHVPLARTDDLPGLVERLRAAGLVCAAAVHTADTDVWACDFRGPTLIVIGNEGTGIRQEILSRCNRQVRIPQFGHVSSLNAAVSAGILLYEVRRQRTAG